MTVTKSRLVLREKNAFRVYLELTQRRPLGGQVLT